MSREEAVMRFVFASAVFFSAWTLPAAADLYRWVDPETGSVKFSSYPPPWYHDAAKQRRAPGVEHIPAGRPSRAVPEELENPAQPAGVPGRSPETLAAQRKEMLQQFAALAAQAGTEKGSQALQKHMDALTALSNEIDRLDPPGAAGRRGEFLALVDKLAKSQFSGSPR